MTYTPENGQINDAAWRAQAIETVGGNYLVDPVPSVAVGGSATSIEMTVSSGTMVAGGDYPTVNQQTVTLPDGDAADPRVDLVTLDTTGTAGSMTGTPAPAQDADGNPSDFRFPNVAQPTPQTPAPADDVVVVAAVWVPAGITSSEEMYDDWIIPREVPGDGLNDRTLLPGRDLQFRLDTATEGDELRGDRSHPITLPQPLTVNTPGIDIDGLNLQYADGAATADTDDMLTIDAPDVTVRNLTLDGNKQNQPAAPDGVTVTNAGDNATVENVRGVDIAGYLVNVNGGGDAANPLEGVSVETITATTPQKGALVVQGEANRTVAEEVDCDNAAVGGGAVLVRNGPHGTELETVYAKGSDHVLRIEDFGAGNDATAAVENLKAESLVADATPQIVANGTANGVGHREVRLHNLRGRNFPANGADLVDLSNINSTAVLNSSFRGFDGGHAIRAAGANSFWAQNISIADGDPAQSGILVVDCSNIDISECVISATGDETDFTAGINVTSDDGDVLRRVTINENKAYPAANFAEAPIRLNDTDDGAGQINEAIVKDNIATVDNQTGGANVIVKDNIPT